MYGVSLSESAAGKLPDSRNQEPPLAQLRATGQRRFAGTNHNRGRSIFGLPVLLESWIAWTLLTEQTELNPRNHLSMVKLATSPQVSALLFRPSPQIGCDPILWPVNSCKAGPNCERPSLYPRRATMSRDRNTSACDLDRSILGRLQGRRTRPMMGRSIRAASVRCRQPVTQSLH
jgi:hypothetical protein